jgi:hypothetical protein
MRKGEGGETFKTPRQATVALAQVGNAETALFWIPMSTLKNSGREMEKRT